jgi:hypothetical protein
MGLANTELIDLPRLIAMTSGTFLSAGASVTFKDTPAFLPVPRSSVELQDPANYFTGVMLNGILSNEQPNSGKTVDVSIASIMPGV